MTRHQARPPLSQTLQRLERDAHRLRAEHASDLLVRLVIAIDLQVRRLAHHVATRLAGRGRAQMSTH